MGMFSCLKVHCVLKDEYIDIIKRVYEIKKQMGRKAINVDEYETSHNPWRELLKEYDLPFIEEWLKGKSRTRNILRTGNIGYELDSWDWIGIKGNEWKFICEFKDYKNEMHTFASQVLPKICIKVIHCEFIYLGNEDSEMIYENKEF